MSQWKWITRDNPAQQRQAVYAIYKDGKLHYVGASTKVLNRLRQHGIGVRKHRSGLTCKVRYVKKNPFHREERLIRRLVPPGNQLYAKPTVWQVHCSFTIAELDVLGATAKEQGIPLSSHVTNIVREHLASRLGATHRAVQQVELRAAHTRQAELRDAKK